MRAVVAVVRYSLAYRIDVVVDPCHTTRWMMTLWTDTERESDLLHAGVRRSLVDHSPGHLE